MNEHISGAFISKTEEQGWIRNPQTGKLEHMTRFTSFDPPMRSSLESQYVSKQTLRRDRASEEFFEYCLRKTYLLYGIQQQACQQEKPKSLVKAIKSAFKRNSRKGR